MNGFVSKFKKLSINRYIDMAILVFLLIFPFIGNTYWVYVMSGIVAYMIFAISLDLLWGYTGLMSMGHSLLFGAGGYMIGISCSYINKADWVTYEKLPWFLAPLSTEIGAFIMALILPAIISLIIGFFMFSGKIAGTFFALITLALSGVAELFVTNQSVYTHGNSGISIVSRTLISDSKDNRMSDVGFYYVIIVAAVICYLICIIITSTRTGKILQAIRENENRLVFFGYKPAAFKMFIYTLSGAMAGLAGVLYVRTQGSVNSTAVGINLATLVLVWVAVGGRGNLTGALVGTLVLQVTETILNSVFSGISSDFAQLWKLVLGVIILLIVFFLPKGIIGSIVEAQQKARDVKRKEMIMNK